MTELRRGEPPTGLPGGFTTLHARDSIEPAPDAVALTDWLMGPARDLPELSDVVGGLGWRLNRENVPVSRCTLFLGTLHPQLRAYAVRWWQAWRKIQNIDVRHGIENLPAYRDSPMQAVIEQGRAVRCRLSPDSPTPFPILTEIRQAGGTDYVAMPVIFSHGRRHCVTFSTDRPGGFEDGHLARLEAILPPLALVLELHAQAHIARDLLRIYLGRQAGARVLAGVIRRGMAERIRAIILVADMRGFTALSNRLPGELVVEILNEFFALLVDAVHAAEGEVLKFLGDGLIAVFPFADEASAREAAGRALAAARQGLAAVTGLGVRRGAAGEAPIGAGMAMHVGEVLFGNVGAPDRLDFTAIGPAVNLASRIEGLNKSLGRRLLASRDFAAICPTPGSSLGTYALAGLDEPCEVFDFATDADAGGEPAPAV